jgi:uncharacterized membrane protein YphA (DoxX/SURF4 family)
MTQFKEVARASWVTLRSPHISFAFRLALGGTLIFSGVGKAQEGSAFVAEVEKYALLPDAVAQVYATLLPGVEIAIGVLLILGLVTRFAAGVGLLATLSLIIANAVVLYRGLTMECACFGSLATLHTRDAIIVDCIMLLMAVQILLHRGDFLSLDSVVRRRRRAEPPAS